MGKGEANRLLPPVPTLYEYAIVSPLENSNKHQQSNLPLPSLAIILLQGKI